MPTEGSSSSFAKPHRRINVTSVMNSCFRNLFTAIGGIFIIAGGTSVNGEQASDRQVENLAEFARVYGYVRFFYPSDAAASIDWDKFAIFGVGSIRDAADPADARQRLLKLFGPIAPKLRISVGDHPQSDDTNKSLRFGDAITFWEYKGIRLSKESNVYQSERVVIGGPSSENSLFSPPERYPAPIHELLGSDLTLWMPTALSLQAESYAAKDSSAELSALRTSLSSIDLKTLTPEDWRLRVAGVIETWNVFQHFHPYLDQIEIKWDEMLRPSIRRALTDRTVDEYYATLSELVAKTRDGHGYVYGQPHRLGGLPIRVDLIEGQLVITGVKANTPFRKGDIIQQIDGISALDALHEREKYVSGSPQLRDYRALNQFGEGPVNSAAKVGLLRDGIPMTVQIARDPERRGYFFNRISEFQFPAIAEIKPGIFYINLPKVRLKDFEANVPKLAAASGLIFDQRWDGSSFPTSSEESVLPTEHVIPHLIDHPVHASPMLIPQIIAPDRAGWTYSEVTWPVQPELPKFKGRIVFINEPSVVSYGETCMAILADYHLALLVGAPTAGCNGNVNFILLPGGFRIMWTGMEVLKHDHTSFYLKGFVPNYPVARTIKAVKEGRDEYLDKAIQVIEDGG
jgi:C-terminal processing protease CtpA/Prc